MRKIKEFWENGNVKAEGELNKEGKKEGEWKFYNENNIFLAKGSFKNGYKDGI